MMRKEKTMSSKNQTCSFCQKAPLNTCPMLSPCWGISLCHRHQQELLHEEGSPGHSPDSKPGAWNGWLWAKSGLFQAKFLIYVKLTPLSNILLCDWQFTASLEQHDILCYNIMCYTLCCTMNTIALHSLKQSINAHTQMYTYIS